MTLRKFSCISECSDCCIYREYYPSIEYGKVGVLILPDEKQKIERYAKKMGLEITILPRLGIGTNRSKDGPETIIAYQLMGKNSDGNLCPFLDIESLERSPHGGFKCRIYDKKPVACTAYPVNEEDKKTVTLDSKCKFCQVNNNEDLTGCTKAYKYDLGKEVQALRRIQRCIQVDEIIDIWRYATGIGEQEKQNEFYSQGWVLQHDL
jgi:Fe-S-cluster containining protein